MDIMLPLDLDRLTDVLSLESLKRFGFAPYGDAIDLHTARASPTYHFKMQIAQDHGIFAMIVKDSWVKVECGLLNNNGKYEWGVTLGLHYNHVNGGQNGSTIGSLWFDTDFNYIDHRIGC